MFYLVKNKTEVIEEDEKKGKLRKIYKAMSSEDKAIHKVSKKHPSGKIEPIKRKSFEDELDDVIDSPVIILTKKEARRAKKRNAKLLRTMHLYDKIQLDGTHPAR